MGYGDPLVTTDGPAFGQNIVVNVGTAGSLTPAEHEALDHAEIPGVPSLLEAEINLTDAQIKGMFATPVQVVPAPGAGKRIVVVSWDVALSNAAGLYTAGGSSHLSLGAQVSGTVSAAFFTGDASAAKLYGSTGTATGTAAMVNQPLMITNSTGAFTGGNAANKATVHVVYQVRSAVPAG